MKLFTEPVRRKNMEKNNKTLEAILKSPSTLTSAGLELKRTFCGQKFTKDGLKRKQPTKIKRRYGKPPSHDRKPIKVHSKIRITNCILEKADPSR